MKTKSLAGIDIGTNTFRLLIAEVYPVRKLGGSLKEIHSERIITRLGEGVSETNLLKEEAIDKSISALKEFKKIISGHQVDALAVVGTSALRDAGNSLTFLERAKEESGIDIKIISEEEEARLTSLGMMMDIAVPESALLVDVGGGSTEFIFVKENEPLSIHSLNLGVVYLTDKHMKNDPPAEEEIKRMDIEISKKLISIETWKEFLSKETAFIGTAGTITTLSAMVQDLNSFKHNRIHNSRILFNSVKDIFSEISKTSTRQRAEKYPVLESPRLNIIVPGTLILLKIMMTFGFREVIVSDNGLREGIILDLYKTHEIED